MRTAIVLLVALFSASCTRIVFDVPQPRDTETLSAFPAEFQGKYLAEGGSHDSILIDSKVVTLTALVEKEISTIRMDTMQNISLKGGLIYDRSVPELGGLPYVIEDTLLRYSYVNRMDLGISDTIAVKSMGSVVVVNFNDPGDNYDYWDIYLLRLSKNGDLEVSAPGNLRTPDSPEEGEYDGNLETFSRIVPYERLEEQTYLFRPDEKQFNKLVEKNLFSETETYRRAD